jgi:tRNA (guanine37-N1)-methyltransferase
MQFAVVSLFPEIFKTYFNCGVVGRAVSSSIVNVTYHNPRDFTVSKYGTVDDAPFGGGAGMVLKPEPIAKAIIDAKAYIAASSQSEVSPKVLYLTPQGKTFTQEVANKLASSRESIVLLSGRYEGVDERVINSYVDDEYSIGDYVLSGGELPALVILDSIIRLLPGVLGDQDSIVDESFSSNLSGCLEYPQYTRPVEFNNMKVPDILRSGNHQAIARWRLKQSLGRTWLRRPNLLKCRNLTENESLLLEEFKIEYQNEHED